MTPLLLPAVYFAGPIDYIEHRSARAHLQDNWRHRFFGHLPIEVLCPTCINQGELDFHQIMVNNADAMQRAVYFVGYFPGDAATFGTPIEVYEWAITAFQMNRMHRQVLVHPSRPGVFVRQLESAMGLVVVRSFEEASQWLRRQLTQP